MNAKRRLLPRSSLQVKELLLRWLGSAVALHTNQTRRFGQPINMYSKLKYVYLLKIIYLTLSTRLKFYHYKFTLNLCNYLIAITGTVISLCLSRNYITHVDTLVPYSSIPHCQPALYLIYPANLATQVLCIYECHPTRMKTTITCLSR